MKKVIDGKRYDTETAEEIASDSNNISTSDFNWYKETLYKTKNGNWFLQGEGGAMSRYSKSAGQNSWTGGSGIIPLTKQEALEWFESNNEVDAIEEHFKDAIVDA